MTDTSKAVQLAIDFCCPFSHQDPECSSCNIRNALFKLSDELVSLRVENCRIKDEISQLKNENESETIKRLETKCEELMARIVDGLKREGSLQKRLVVDGWPTSLY